MGEGGEGIKIENFQSKPEPIGIRTIGKVNPRTLSKEAFHTNPEILYHGSAEPIKFDRKFDFSNNQSDGSTTLGDGFYTIPSLEEAINYSRIRQGKNATMFNITSILPHETKMLDLRQKNDETRNAPMESDFIKDWVTYYEQYYSNKPKREGFLGETLDYFELQYLAYLKKVAQKQPDIELRQLLATATTPEGFSMAIAPSPPWSKLFRDFMLSKGIDGIIYNEGGEGTQGKGGATYAFYNLEKIGDYDAWDVV